MLFDVCIPEGVQPGDEIVVVHPESGVDVIVVVPKGLAVGDSMLVSDDELEENWGDPVSSSEDVANELHVVCPQGLFPGDVFTAESATGQRFDVVVPEGSGPGMTIVCCLQSADDDILGDAEPPDGATASGRSSSNDNSDDADFHMYRRGQVVQVLRTDGSFSKATVLASFEGVFDVLYQVRLDSGRIKQAVPEHEMHDAKSCDDPNFGRRLGDAMAAMMDAGTLEAFDTDGDDGGMYAYMQAYWCCGE